jgi:hypothetical protein
MPIRWASMSMDCRIGEMEAPENGVHCLLPKSLWVKRQMRDALCAVSRYYRGMIFKRVGEEPQQEQHYRQMDQ